MFETRGENGPQDLQNASRMQNEETISAHVQMETPQDKYRKKDG